MGQLSLSGQSRWRYPLLPLSLSKHRPQEERDPNSETCSPDQGFHLQLPCGRPRELQLSEPSHGWPCVSFLEKLGPSPDLSRACLAQMPAAAAMLSWVMSSIESLVRDAWHRGPRLAEGCRVRGCWPAPKSHIRQISARGRKLCPGLTAAETADEKLSQHSLCGGQSVVVCDRSRLSIRTAESAGSSFVAFLDLCFFDPSWQISWSSSEARASTRNETSEQLLSRNLLHALHSSSLPLSFCRASLLMCFEQASRSLWQPAFAKQLSEDPRSG